MPAKKKRKPQARSEATRKRILEAAELVFAKRGLRGARIREIASAAGVNGATIYNYYRSKRVLYEAVLERGVQPLQDLVTKFASRRGTPQAEELIGGVIEHLAAQPQLSRLIYLEAISEGSYLPELAQQWFRPLLKRTVDELKIGGGFIDWEEGLFPLVASAFVHLTFGHFALAPLFREAFGLDPFSEEAVELQKRFMFTLTHQMFPGLPHEDA